MEWSPRSMIPVSRSHFEPAEIAVGQAKDLAFVRGAYRTGLTSKRTGKIVNAVGKYIIVYRNDGGTWKAIHDINNRDSKN